MTWSQLAHLAGLAFDAPAMNLPQCNRFFPAQMAPVIYARNNQKLTGNMHWGLVPEFWNKPLEEKKFSTYNYNSRAADWLDKPTFRRAIRQTRCAVPATYFCEYTGEKGSKTTVPFTRPDQGPFAMAGVWNHWRGAHKGEPVQLDTFSILTTEPNEVVRPIHPKAMPVLLEWSELDLWLSGSFGDAIALAKPCPDDRLIVS